MNGNLQALGLLRNQFETIGAEHVRSDGDALVAGTRGAFGRAVNWLRSIGKGDAAQNNRAVVGNLVAKLRDAGVNDAKLDVAQRLLSSHCANGKPISGRTMAMVTATVIKLTREELPISANLDINITGLQERLGQEFDDIFSAKATRFGMGDTQPTAEERQQLLGELRTKCRQWGESHGLRSPGLAEARAMLTESCRVLCLQKLNVALEVKLQSVADHSTADAPLCTMLRSAMQDRGMHFDFKPEDLDKLQSRMGARFTSEFKFKNTHPPTQEEATAVANRVVHEFLDSLAIVDNHPSLTADQRAVARDVLISFPAMLPPNLTTAVCDSIGQVAQSMDRLISGQLGPQEMKTAISNLPLAINAAAAKHLRPGVDGADEVGSLRNAAIAIGAKLAHMPEGQSPRSVFERLTAPESDFTALCFSLGHGDPNDRQVSNERAATVQLLDVLAHMAGIDAQQFAIARQVPGVGQLSMAQVRAVLPQGVHSLGWPEPQQVDVAKLSDGLVNGLKKTMERPSDFGGVTVPGASQEFQTDYLPRFGTQFLKDFFRNGMAINGHLYGATGTNDPVAMERELRAFADAFPSIEEAGKVTYALHQAMAADVLTSMAAQPALRECTMELLSAQGRKTVEMNTVALTSRPDGSYAVAYDLRLQFANRDSIDEPTRALGLNAHADMRIALHDGMPTVDAEGFDIAFSRNALDL